MKQLILHIPHSSIQIPLMEGFIVDDDVLQVEILKLTDWFTDDLFYSKEDIQVIAGFSRIFCDPERFADDKLEIMSQVGMGVLYERSDDGKIIRNINPELRERILTEYYWPHHSKLNIAIKCQLEQHKKAMIIDCHSYPNIPMVRDLNQDADRPDFNIGTDLFHTPQNLIDISINFFKFRGFSCGVDWPYKGSIVPIEYYHKNRNVQTIMLEINRKLYLKEPTNEKSEGYSEIKAITMDFINTIRACL
jgi:N-formylglutamate amidohydrolase